jgi:hypothetical protein
MELEQSLFLVYERFLYPHVHSPEDDDNRIDFRCSRLTPRKTCLIFTGNTFLVGLITLIMLFCLQSAFVGKGGCFEASLNQIALNRNMSLNNLVTDDDVYRIIVDYSSEDIYPDPLINSGRNFAPTYIFSRNKEPVTMGQISRTKHNYTVYNMTIPSTCPSATTAWGFVFPALVSYDTVIVNSVMWTFPNRPGTIVSGYTGEEWGWTSAESLNTSPITSKAYNFISAWVLRVMAIIECFFAYFLLSSVSAMLVRILITSGPILLYAFMFYIQLCASSVDLFRSNRFRVTTNTTTAGSEFTELSDGEGASGSTTSAGAAPTTTAAPRTAQSSVSTIAYRELNSAYPWLGTHIRYIRAHGYSPSDFILAHLQYLAALVIMYECSTTLLGQALYGWKSLPASLSLTVWATFLLIEYLSYLFLRTTMSILIFPKLFFIYFFLFQTYYYVVPYGFTYLTSFLFFLTSLGSLFLVVALFEIPAMRRNEFSVTRPRVALVRMFTPDIRGVGSYPLLWSVFSSLNFKLETLYEGRIPEAPMARANVRSPGGGAAAAADALEAREPVPFASMPQNRSQPVNSQPLLDQHEFHETQIV